MEVWIVVATACSECNIIGAVAFDHEPSTQEVESVTGSIGGMYCISTNTFRLQVNGDRVTQPERHDE